jgi:cbb3-type cytochrome c oxidase subunit III
MGPPDITPQESRENADPQEASRPIPAWLLVITVLLVISCVYYIVRSDAAAASAYGDSRTLSDLAQKPKSAASAGATADGAAIFAARCVACHQATGTGVPGAFPPLAGSNWVNGRDTTLIQILLHGIQGPLTVNGAPYNGTMPTFGTQLSDAEIAAVLTHVRSQWGNKTGPVSTAQVTTQRSASAGRSEPWHGDADLTKLP